MITTFPLWTMYINIPHLDDFPHGLYGSHILVGPAGGVPAGQELGKMKTIKTAYVILPPSSSSPLPTYVYILYNKT